MPVAAYHGHDSFSCFDHGGTWIRTHFFPPQRGTPGALHTWLTKENTFRLLFIVVGLQSSGFSYFTVFGVPSGMIGFCGGGTGSLISLPHGRFSPLFLSHLD